jgi:hypothetical protein
VIKLATLSLLFALATAAHAQDSKAAPPAPLDGPNRTVSDALLDKLAGDWKVVRTFPNRTEQNTVHAEWVLNHQFLEVHYRDAATPTKYEAMVFIGYDNTSERYVAHWIDVFGGRFSETLGYGTRNGNAIRFTFEYPDGPFHNTYTFDQKAGTWTSLMEQKNPRGEWVRFAEDRFSTR